MIGSVVSPSHGQCLQQSSGTPLTPEEFCDATSRSFIRRNRVFVPSDFTSGTSVGPNRSCPRSRACNPTPLTPPLGPGVPVGGGGSSGGNAAPSPFPSEVRSLCEQIAKQLPPGGWCAIRQPAAGSQQARLENYGVLIDALNRVYGTGAGVAGGIVRMDVVIRNAASPGGPAAREWTRLLEGLTQSVYVDNRVIVGSSTALQFARSARRNCIELEIELTGSAVAASAFSSETTECFRASMVLLAEATRQPLDPNLDQTWADGLAVDFGARGFGISLDINTLINRMFPTPSTRSLAAENSFIRFQDAITTSRQQCASVRAQLLDKGCVR